jgi:hypothetical protein
VNAGSHKVTHAPQTGDSGRCAYLLCCQSVPSPCGAGTYVGRAWFGDDLIEQLRDGHRLIPSASKASMIPGAAAVVESWVEWTSTTEPVPALSSTRSRGASVSGGTRRCLPRAPTCIPTPTAARHADTPALLLAATAPLQQRPGDVRPPPWAVAAPARTPVRSWWSLVRGKDWSSRRPAVRAAEGSPWQRLCPGRRPGRVRAARLLSAAAATDRRVSPTARPRCAPWCAP